MDKFYGRFVYFEDTVTYFDKIVMFSHRGEANRYIEIYPAIIVLKWGLNALFYTAELKTLYFVIICSAEGLLMISHWTVINSEWSIKEMGIPQLDSRDWSMYSNILKFPW